MANVRVLRHVEIAQDNACRHRGLFQVFHAEAFEVFHLEMLQQFLAGRVARECPVVHFKDKEARAEHLREAGLAAALHQHLFRCKAAQEFVDIFCPPLCHEKLARRDVEQRHAHGRRAVVNGTEEIVFFRVEHIVCHRHARRYEFRDAALHEFLREFRVFQLVADGHAETRANEARQICVERVEGEARHFRCRPVALVVAARERNAQHTRSRHGIGGICFVKVAAAKQQNGIRVFGLEVIKLLHHRRKRFLWHIFSGRVFCRRVNE